MLQIITDEKIEDDKFETSPMPEDAKRDDDEPFNQGDVDIDFDSDNQTSRNAMVQPEFPEDQNISSADNSTNLAASSLDLGQSTLR